MRFMKSFILCVTGLIFFLSACGESEPPRKKRPPHTTCEPEVISKEECFFILPSLPHGEDITFTHRYDKEINTKGIVLGQGKWRCNKGTWEPVYQHVCLNCLPGRSFEQCKSKLYQLLDHFNKWQGFGPGTGLFVPLIQGR